MTATELFSSYVPKPRFVALEALREKRTGVPADEWRPADILQEEFPDVDFSDLQIERQHIDTGEDKGNSMVRKRAKSFFEGHLPFIPNSSLAIVTHKGWLRELRHIIYARVDSDDLLVDFNLDQ